MTRYRRERARGAAHQTPTVAVVTVKTATVKTPTVAVVTRALACAVVFPHAHLDRHVARARARPPLPSPSPVRPTTAHHPSHPTVAVTHAREHPVHIQRPNATAATHPRPQGTRAQGEKIAKSDRDSVDILMGVVLNTMWNLLGHTSLVMASDFAAKMGQDGGKGEASAISH